MKLCSSSILSLLAASLLFAACQAPDPAFYTDEGRHLAETPPVLFRVAVAPVRTLEGVSLQEQQDGLRFTMDEPALQQRLVRGMQQVNAATAIMAVGAKDLEEAREQRADLLLRPRITSVRMAHKGAADNFLLSSFLWLTTWAGGTFVTDSEYDAHLQIEWEVINPYDGTTVDSTVASSETAALSFWQRNSFVSFATLQSIVLPPVLTSDNDERTSTTLSETAADRVAARLTKYLKGEFTGRVRDILGEVRVDAPRHDTTSADTIHLRGRIVAREPITDLGVYLNDASQPVLAMDAEKLPPMARQRRGSTFQVGIQTELRLRPGTNHICIEYAVRGTYTSRTLKIHSQAGAAQ